MAKDEFRTIVVNSRPRSPRAVGELLFVATWIAALVVALLLLTIPILLVIAMIGLAVGFTKGMALASGPIFVGVFYVACVMASKYTASTHDARRDATLAARAPRRAR